MPADTLPCMARKKQPPVAAPSQTTAPVRIHADLVRMANIISTATGADVAEILSPILRPHLEARYADVVRKLNQEIKE